MQMWSTMPGSLLGTLRGALLTESRYVIHSFFVRSTEKQMNQPLRAAMCQCAGGGFMTD